MNQSMTIKYAVLVSSYTLEPPTEVTDFGANAYLSAGQLTDHLEAEQLDTWKAWVGSAEWDDLLEGHMFLFTHCNSPRPKVDDHENTALMQRLQRAWYALQLAMPSRPRSGAMWMLSGTGEVKKRSVLPQTVSRLSKPPILIRPSYVGLEAFDEAFPWTDYDDWLSRWLNADSLLPDNLRSLPKIIDSALVSYSQALQQPFLDFSIPAYIRSVECIIALPRRKGKAEFAERAMQLAPELADDPFLGWGSKTRSELADLYQLRSDCVHGKVPFAGIQSQGREGNDRAARFEYAAQRLARRAVLWSLDAPATYFQNRLTLEEAWQSGIPS